MDAFPEDWEVKRLGDCCLKIGSGVTPTGGSKVYLSYGISFIRSQNVYNGYFKYEGLVYISESTGSLLEGVAVSEDDVLLNITGDSVARCTTVPSSVLPARVSQHVAIIRTVKDYIDPYYLQCYLTTPSMQLFMLNVATGQGGSRNALTKGMVANFQIPRPPLPEQRRIAAALGDMDKLIDNLSKRIEKKKAIKQGAMQELLTGKKRLPGFSKNNGGYDEGVVATQNGIGGGAECVTTGSSPSGGSDWCVRSVKSMLKIGHGKDYKSLKPGDVPVFGTGGYMCSVDSFLYEGPTVCIGRKGTIDKPFYHEGKIWTVDTLFYTYDFVDADPKFIYYKFLTVDWLGYNAASGVPSLTSQTIEQIELRMPSIEEQRAIAKVLSGMDAEIANLERKLEKLKFMKQGMMQDLLTGKVRLK